MSVTQMLLWVHSNTPDQTDSQPGSWSAPNQREHIYTPTVGAMASAVPRRHINLNLDFK